MELISERRSEQQLLLQRAENDGAKSIYALDEMKSLQEKNLEDISSLASAWRAAVDNL